MNRQAKLWFKVFEELFISWKNPKLQEIMTFPWPTHYFYHPLQSVNEPSELRGYVQINDSEWKLLMVMVRVIVLFLIVSSAMFMDSPYLA